LRFRSLEKRPPEASISFRFDGRTIAAAPGQTIAAALLSAGQLASRRSSRGDAMHGPYCLMGACFECLVDIEGMGKCQSCMTPVRDGMDVRTG
jgi:predicted molibdopterin-dependent oxidoreductase YjgC